MSITLTSLSNNLVNEIYSTLNNLVVTINKYTKNESYAIKKRRFKLCKKDVFIKVAIVCDAHNKTKFTKQDYCLIFDKRKKCSFRYNIKLENNNKNKHNIKR